MQLSALIPTYNRSELLSRTLPTLFQQSCSPDAYEVIVVVDGATDGTAEVLGKLHPACGFQILEQPNRGQAAARNVALRAARGDLVLFLDDDLLCDPDLIAEHIAAHRSREDQVVFGPIYVSPESPPTLAARWTRSRTNAWFERLHREGASWPLDAKVVANSSVGRKILLGFGGFDEDLFRALEDLELGLRLWRAGVRFRFHPTALTYEFYTRSNRDFIHGNGTFYGRNGVRLARKYPSMRRYGELARYSNGVWFAWKCRSTPGHGEPRQHSKGSLAKVWIMKMAVRMPWFDVLASLPCWLAERLPKVWALEQIGLPLLLARRAVATLRSAAAEAGGWKNLEREFGAFVPVLLYHNVGPYRRGTVPSLTISPKKFEKHVRWLKRHGYVGIRPSDWVAWCRDGKELPSKPVMLTFDDAYADCAEDALPILKRYDFGSAVFVVTDQIGGTNAWDEKCGRATLHCMTAEQIRRWSTNGIEFGAHSRTHPDLRTLSDADLSNEIQGSAQHLSSLLGSRVSVFAYPYGYYSEAVRKHAEEIFDLAFTLDEGLNGLSTDSYLLHRTKVYPTDTLIDLAFYVKLGWSPIPRLRRLRERLRARTRLAHAWDALRGCRRWIVAGAGRGRRCCL